MGLLFSCKKESHNQFSHWYVGNDSFSSNNVIIRYPPKFNGPSAVLLVCNDANNNFDLGFDLANLPLNGTFLIKDNNSDSVYYNSSTASIYIRNKSAYYIVSPTSNTYLTASSVNNKASYTMPPTWFINYFNDSDSVLIHGVFNQP